MEGSDATCVRATPQAAPREPTARHGAGAERAGDGRGRGVAVADSPAAGPAA
jgi:hypothetical protein